LIVGQWAAYSISSWEFGHVPKAIGPYVWTWFAAVTVGIIFTAGIYWYLPLLPWWVYVILFTISAGLAAKDWREIASGK